VNESALGERRPSDAPAELLACTSALPGKRTVKAEPLPGSLVTVTSPPIIRASFRVMARPPGETAHRRPIGVGHGGAALWADASWAFPVVRLDGTPKTRVD